MTDLQVDRIDQIGIVVKDIDKAIGYYSTTFGIGPFKVFESTILDSMVRGKKNPLKMKTAFCRIGQLQIELIENIEGENIYTEFIESKGEGVHHVAVAVDDVEEEISRWEKQGIQVLQRGRLGGMSWAYMDTDKIGGLIIELIPKRRASE